MSDDRPVHTDALHTLGTVIDDKQGRDAIHLAVEPAVAADYLKPGQNVSYRGGVAMADGEHVGIVDPFLKSPVVPGQRFWLVVFPRQITSLRHVWSHPAFPEASAESLDADDRASVSKAWVRNFADSVGLGYQTVMDGADAWLRSGGDEYLCFGGLLEGESVPSLFWDHYEIITGKTIGDDDLKRNFFTCSC